MSEPPIEYATADRAGEATRSLAASWGVSLQRAADCLRDPVEYRAELRSRQPLTAARALRELAERLPPRGPS